MPTIKENDTDTYDEDLIEGTIASNLISTQNTNNSNNNKTNSNRDQQPIFVSKNNGNNPNGIHVRGSLKIDSVKITSWDPEKNDIIGFAFGKRAGEEHTKSDYHTAMLGIIKNLTNLRMYLLRRLDLELRISNFVF